MHIIWEIYIIGHSSAKKEEEENRNLIQLNVFCGPFLSVSLKDVILWKQNR